jgi:hypothetical protein
VTITRYTTLGLILALLTLAILVGCTPPAEEAAEAPPVEEEEVAPPPTEPSTEEPPAEPEEPGLLALPPDPQAVEFETSDGVGLVGTYYPAAVNPAPIVVLMHWAGGDQNDWVDLVPLALILQNRQGESAARGAGLARPASAREVSYGVLTFNFRGYPPSSDAPGEKYLDAQAAVQFAKTLDGANPDMIMTAGASIGADGAVDGCVDSEGAPACIAAIALSPGNYIGMDFTQAVLDVGDIPIACVATEGDALSADTCRAAEAVAGDKYQIVMYTGHEHGMQMFDITDQEPLLLDFIPDFFDSAVESYLAVQ